MIQYSTDSLSVPSLRSLTLTVYPKPAGCYKTQVSSLAIKAQQVGRFLLYAIVTTRVAFVAIKQDQ
jgi:hypothetical protein